ncbi:MAG: hypothetical protein JNM28_06965 [Armatimonadetes bacterium]|nr:hypothetical protein [Armatimonadota bacterium]
MDIEIKKPCPANWDAMTGDEQSRFCGQCQKSVHNISEMTAEEAASILCKPGQKACIRITRAQDGSFRTKSGWVKRVALAGAAGLALIPMAGCGPNGDGRSAQATQVPQSSASKPKMDEVAVPGPGHETLTGDIAVEPVETQELDTTLGKFANPDLTDDTTVGVVAPAPGSESPN